MSAGRFLKLRLVILIAAICTGLMLVYAVCQETPVGSLAGKVITLESGNPVQARVRLTDRAGKSFHLMSHKDGSFRFIHIPVGLYWLEAQSEVHSMESVPMLIEEGKTEAIKLELKANEPQLNLYIHQHIFTPDEKARITCHGFVPVNELQMRIYKVDTERFLSRSNGSLRDMLNQSEDASPLSRNTSLDLDKNWSLSLVKSIPILIVKRDLEGVFTQRINLPALEPGMYITDLKTEKLRQFGWIMVTSLGMVTKTAGKEILAYTVDLKTGVPRPSADVMVYVGKQVFASGKTDSKGLVTLSLSKEIRNYDSEMIVARDGSSFAFVSEHFSSMEKSDKTIYAYTERPVYKPGQKVFFKGMVRETKSGGYVVPSSMPVTIEVRDSLDSLIYRAVRQTDRFGCYAIDFDLNSEASTGYYTIVSEVGGKSKEVGFQVAAYCKPEFTLKVTYPQRRFVRGDIVHAKVSAKYYFGAPVADAEVHYVIRRSQYWIFGNEETGDEEDDSTEGYRDYGGYGETVTEGDVTTDSNGDASVEFSANWGEEEAWYSADADQQFSVNASITDKSDQEVSGTASVLVTRGEFALQVLPSRYVMNPGESADVSIQAIDYDKHPMKHQELTVVTAREKWLRGAQTVTIETLKEQTVTTDDAGRATVRCTGSKGDMVIIAKTTDKRGNKISSRTYIWCYGGEDFGNEEDSHIPDLQIVPDKKTYNIGDTAEILIKAKNPGATALVTIEGSRVYDRQLVTLSKKSTLVRFPIRNDYKPNFYIGVCFVKNKEFSSQTARVKVSLNLQALQIKVTPNKSKYRPGENAVYKIKVTDSKGRPAIANLSVGVVDEAIYAIAEDTTRPMLDYFYAHKPNSVETSFSFPQIYLSDPDKAGASLLTSGAPDVRIRKKFLDTAFWDSNVTTNRNGEATVKFTLPDNLTTWRTTVRGITLDSSCGESKSTVLAQQDFLVRLEMPRFLVQSDKATISAIVHNYTGQGQDVRVNLWASGLKIDGGAQRRVYVKENGVEKVEWNVTGLTPGSALVTVKATSNRIGDAMQLVLSIYAHGAERVANQVGSIPSGESAKMNLDIRNDSIPDAEKLKIHLAPSLASSLLGSLKYLAEYPWGCTEQTTSSWLPDVILSRSMKELGIRDPKLEAELPDMVTKGLFRLYRYQLEDGGWSWYTYGQADPWMTAYVCYGIIQARNAGFQVNESVLKKGLSRLAKLELSVRTKTYDKNENPVVLRYLIKDNMRTDIYCLYVLSLSGVDESENLAQIAVKSEVDNKMRALIALSYASLNQSSKAKAALDDLFNHAISDQATIHWAGDWFGEGVETTALGLEAVMSIEPNDPRTTQIVRWIMQNRRYQCWESTRDTAMVLYAMSKYLKISNELSPDMNVEVLVNGRSVARKHFDKSSLFEPEFEVVAPNSSLRKGRNSIEIKKTGTGVIYYSTKLTQYIPGDLNAPTVTGPGLSITREYYNPGREYFDDESDSGMAFSRYHNAKPDPRIGSPVTSCKTGDSILVRLTITTKEQMSHLLVEDFVPAGFEIVDRGHIDYSEWHYWWVGQDIRDEKIAFFLNDIRPGKQVIEYRMRASFGGDYHALPAQVFEMYNPELRSTTAETEFVVR